LVLKDLEEDGWILLILIFKKWDGAVWTALIWLRIRKGEGGSKNDKELSGPMKCGEFLD